MGTPGKRSIVDIDSIVSPFRGFEIYTDTCGRITKCKFCNLPIFKGEKRLAFAVRGVSGGTGGGTITRRVTYVHPSCMSAYVEAPQTPPKIKSGSGGASWATDRSCIACGAPDGSHKSRINLWIYGRICEECSLSPAFRMCPNCLLWVPSHKISNVTSPDNGGSGGVRPTAKSSCDECAVVYGIETVKTQKTKKREELKIQNSVDKIREKYLGDPCEDS
jgi:hypothetical protein